MTGEWIHPQVTPCPFSPLGRLEKIFQSVSFIWAQDFVVYKVEAGHETKGQGSWRISLDVKLLRMWYALSCMVYTLSDDTGIDLHVGIIL